jgi:hypothetical protein
MAYAVSASGSGLHQPGAWSLLFLPEPGAPVPDAAHLIKINMLGCASYILPTVDRCSTSTTRKGRKNAFGKVAGHSCEARYTPR